MVGVIRDIGHRTCLQRIILAFHVQVSLPLDCIDDVLPGVGVAGSLSPFLQRKHSHHMVFPALLGTDQNLLGDIFGNLFFLDEVAM